jgi:hypothetical protein
MDLPCRHTWYFGISSFTTLAYYRLDWWPTEARRIDRPRRDARSQWIHDREMPRRQRQDECAGGGVMRGWRRRPAAAPRRLGRDAVADGSTSMMVQLRYGQRSPWRWRWKDAATHHPSDPVELSMRWTPRRPRRVRNRKVCTWPSRMYLFNRSMQTVLCIHVKDSSVR